ncbi:hypothetical protein QRX37_24095 (plasmid) [Escherichia coli]|uniref:hypothetical protein n=1 Tax=Escherichia coli TaxID=562 RepID=UPI0028525536|nr:hypothetical protein [Escherichia coli]WLE92836.1 hypothetical protein BBIOGGPN_00003 [Escherichia coli]
MVGSRWYKFDFHNHTPASHDYKIPDISPREWLLAYMKQHAFQESPHAVEIRHRVEDITDGTRRRLIDNLPWLRGSDAHHPEQAGMRTCWLKMSSPDFDGLRHALLDPENCVLFDQLPPEEHPPLPSCGSGFGLGGIQPVL